MPLHLPEDIISEILLKLPADSLINLKPVSKSFSSLISDSHFSHTHLLHHQDDQLIVIEVQCHSPFIYDFWCIKLQEFKDMKRKKFNTYRKLQQQMKLGVLLRASCDGLLLLQRKSNANQLYVCNPIIPFYWKLPNLEVKGLCIWNWALVLDNSNDSGYMVVGISANSRKCFVFKSGIVNQWKEVITPYQESKFLSGHPLTLINKELHWLVFRQQGYGSTIRDEPHIYSMNTAMKELDFKEIKVSPSITCRFNHNSILEVKGCFCLTDSISCRNQLDIWTLYDRDKRRCRWTKTHTISLECQIDNPVHVTSFTQSHPSVILIQYKNQLLFYDLENKDIKIIDLRSKHKLITRFQFVHTDSLVRWE